MEPADFQRVDHEPYTMTAVFLDFATVGPSEIDISPLESAVSSLALFNSTPEKQVIERVGRCEFVFINKVRISRAVIEAAGNLRFIGLIATGTDNVDLEAAKEHNVAVANIRSYCTNSVVEHVFAVMLHMARNVGRYDAAVRAGAWQQASDFCMLNYPLRELSSMTLGIVGYGNLGQGVGKLAEAFGMHVMIANRIGSETKADDSRVSLDELLAESDVVSLHCPLTAATENLIDARELEIMKADAMLINTARGGLVNSAALVHALETGGIGAAAIDVLRQEPPVSGDPLLDYGGDNLIVTPHNAWAAVAARQNAVNEVAANVVAFLAGEQRNRVV